MKKNRNTIKTIFPLFGCLFLHGVAPAQLATNEVPVLTNNVQYVWSTNQAATLKSLWRDDYSRAVADYAAATNANPGYATNHPSPTLPTFNAWAAGLFKATAQTNVSAWEAARQARAAAGIRANYATMQRLWQEAWPLLTASQQAAQSNLLYQATAAP